MRCISVFSSTVGKINQLKTQSSSCRTRTNNWVFSNDKLCKMYQLGNYMTSGGMICNSKLLRTFKGSRNNRGCALMQAVFVLPTFEEEMEYLFSMWFFLTIDTLTFPKDTSGGVRSGNLVN